VNVIIVVIDDSTPNTIGIAIYIGSIFKGARLH